jgi:hypothetical protein
MEFTISTFDTTLREYTIKGLTNNTLYSVSIYAINNYGTSQAASVNVTPKPVADPPVFTTTSYADKSVTLNWIPNTPFGVQEPTSFKIYYYIGSGPESSVVVSSGSLRTRTINQLTNNSTYTFRITSTNPSGESPRSIPVSITPNPIAPSSITVTGLTPKDQSAIVAWSVPYNGGSPITSYTITPIPSIGPTITVTDSTLLSAGQGQAVTWKVNGLTNGTSYSFIVTANNGYTYGKNPDFSGGLTVIPLTQFPDAPTDLTSVAGNSSATLSWKVPDVNVWSIPGGQVITE